MPNHFHFIVHANHNSILATPNSSIPMQHLTDGIRILLSGHSKYINERSRRAGNLFQQKTKRKCISVKDNNYALVAFHYTHQNPFKAGLVQRMEDWKFSSFHDYFENRSDSICNLKLAIELLNIEMSHFYEDSYHEIAEEKLKLIL
ncbi:MAG: hypothetical protein LH473_09680 [Chitinophagales bacterium]|nr:hypothetical protein [Chitinophagales bacterium]